MPTAIVNLGLARVPSLPERFCSDLTPYCRENCESHPDLRVEGANELLMLPSRQWLCSSCHQCCQRRDFVICASSAPVHIFRTCPTVSSEFILNGLDPRWEFVAKLHPPCKGACESPGSISERAFILASSQEHSAFQIVTRSTKRFEGPCAVPCPVYR